jgi:O-antigen/teichoic acid export membrane protein
LGLLFTEPGAATLLKGLDRPLSHQIWMLAVVSSLPMALTSILLASTRGTGRMGPSSLNEGLMVPLSRVLLFLVLFVVGLREVGALWAYLASAMVGLALAWWYARDAIATDPGTPKTWEWGTVVPFSLAQGGSGVLETGLFWADTLIIAALLTSGDVGVYGAAGRLALIPTMLLVAFNTVFQPWAASLWARGDREELERLYQQVTRLVTGGSVPFYLLLAAFPGPLLAVFGEEFRTGAIALVVLALGQIANVATGPAANLLSMAGYPSWNFWNNAALLVLNVAANLALVPRFGIIGAAIAWAGSVIVVNAARVVEVRHLTGLIPYDHHLLRISGLLLVGGAILLALRPWQIVSFGEAVLWGAPFVLAWMAAFVVLLPAEDRRLLRELLPIGRAR